MIPKIIHYCWFGRGAKPELVKKSINSWKKYLPEYEYIEWNEDNFNFDLFPYAKQALEAKKYAYVADVVRLYALKEFGGIYMDTDIEVLKPLDVFLHHTAFLGFESSRVLQTGLMASEKGSVWASDLLSYYEGRSFLDDNGKPILTPNTNIITDMMLKEGFLLNNTFQEREGYVAFYPDDVFCAKSSETGKITITPNTHSIHHFSGSWLPKSVKFRHKMMQTLYKFFGKSKVDNLKKIFRNIDG